MNWGRPIAAYDERFPRYSDSGFERTWDTIFIDGRFRVACALKIFPSLKDNTNIFMHDFSKRLIDYGILLRYFDVIKQIDSLVLLKPVTQPPQDIIKKYELIFD